MTALDELRADILYWQQRVELGKICKAAVTYQSAKGCWRSISGN